MAGKRPPRRRSTVVNTGSKYRALFRHLASWGFIVVGNEDPSTCAGTSADEMSIPTLVLAAVEHDVITPDGVKALSDAIPAGTVTALCRDMDHGKMLYSADGYVTAWFMWRLKGDEEAARAFVGENPEILSNALYQDAAVRLDR